MPSQHVPPRQDAFVQQSFAMSDHATVWLRVFEDADHKIAAFQNATGLACPTGCGECCHSPNVEAAVEELVPLAEAVVARGDGEALLARAQAAASPVCVLFEPGRLPGGCTEYPLRPLLCRLFGFSAVRDKHGAPHLALCRVHARETPEVAAAAVAHVEGGGAAPSFTEFSTPLGPKLPINRAIAEAVERELLAASYRDG